MKNAAALTGEHAEDVLGAMLAWFERGSESALIMMTGTEGGAVRSPGALMAVSSEGAIGYMSGGCIDADLILQARQALVSRQVKALRYGAGSPFIDLPLPCGGAIEVLILPNPDMAVIGEVYRTLKQRQSIALRANTQGQLDLPQERPSSASGKFVFDYSPKLRLRIAGRGADALGLAKIGEAAGYETHLQLVDEEDLQAAEAAGLSSIERLDTPGAPLPSRDDAWTAFVLLFHDRVWETALLQQALSGPAFYIGAVGSRRTHEARCEMLREAGVKETEIQRIRGPIGLVPSLRDASMLAVSVLAEIIDLFPARSVSRRPRTALLLLAAGASSRYEDGDKLLAELDGEPVLARAGALAKRHEAAMSVAIVPPDSAQRAGILRDLGWQIIENPESATGQASSLVLGMKFLSQQDHIDQVIVLLGDMPFVPADHLDALCKRAEASSISALMSESEGLLSPPALFKRVHFEDLMAVTGDKGAKAVFLAQTGGTGTIEIDPKYAADIDCLADMERAKESLDA